MTPQEKLILKFLLTTFIIGLVIGWVRSRGFLELLDQTEKAKNTADKIEAIVQKKQSSIGKTDKTEVKIMEGEDDKVSSDIPFPKVNLNSANKEELMSLPRIGPAIAERIIIYRNDYGKFQEIEDLVKVKGIGPKTLAKIQDLITI
ncbi:MAG: helix-hairpin-helix domain-containing protein [Candidatus Marinimicrobia bacterium]|nr:helix-hairpin-helix domain-containing protein [Candidatus Neomarinimicrobiota bacterium]MBL7046439.1 helix-hairpin-helix domain-containing protein [Candidatus Neomarinimicrobiota bacterium]